jgi:hypothetical protein
MATVTRNSYSANNFELLIDGHKPTAYVKSVEGGWSFANITSESQQISSVDIEPITVEFGLGGAADWLSWIQGSWGRKDDPRRNGQITHADFGMRSMFEHHFYKALITETTFPALDGTSKEGGYIKCKLQPEWVDTTVLAKSGPRISGDVSPHQKTWTPAAFRFTIDGVDDMQYTSKIDSFTITVEFTKLYTGAQRFPELVPRNVKFPNITGTIALMYADKLIKWHKDYIRTKDGQGVKDTRAQKSGSIEYLTLDRRQTMLRINLYGVGLRSLSVPSKANEEQIKHVKFELYVDRMEIDRTSIRNFA